MVYSGDGINDDDNDDSDRGSGVDGSNCYSESIDSVLDLPPDSYSKLDVFLCKG